MILSLEDEEEADLQDVTQNVITVDDEYLNGPMLGRSQLFLGLYVGHAEVPWDGTYRIKYIMGWDLRTFIIFSRIWIWIVSYRIKICWCLTVHIF